jgi:hypothetical protein
MADAIDAAAQLAESSGAVAEQTDDQQRLLIADAVEHLAGAAIGQPTERRNSGAHGSLQVTRAP